MNFLALVVGSFVVLLMAIAAMAIGVFFGRSAIAGSCGGVASRCAGCANLKTCRRRAASTARRED